MKATNYAARALALSGKAGGQVMKDRRAPRGGQRNVTRELIEEVEGQDATDACEICGGVLIHLGALGHVSHFRCRDCDLDSMEE
jgi:hypothetical protein